MENNIKVPKRLYLYLNYQAAFELLMTQRLLFSGFEAFNDPFEIMPQSSLTKSLCNKSPIEIQKVLKKYLDEHPDEFTSDELQGIGALSVGAGGALGLLGFSALPIAGLVALGVGLYAAGKGTEKNENKRTPDEKKRKEEEAKEKKRLQKLFKLCRDDLSKIKVCCMSAKSNDILMWSHYARKHTGMVFEFDTSNQFWNESGCDFLKVNYVSSRAVIPNSKEDSQDQKVIDNLISRKFKTWEYEKEWRIVKRDISGAFSLKIPKNVLKGVYLGVRVSSENASIISDILRIQFNNTKLYKAILHNSKYQLLFEQINIHK